MDVSSRQSTLLRLYQLMTNTGLNLGKRLRDYVLMDVSDEGIFAVFNQ